MSKESELGEVSKLISGLRVELIKAQAEGNGNDMRFTVEDIDLELQFTVEASGEGKAGVKFHVFNAGLSAKKARKNMHTLRLKMKLEKTPDGESQKIGCETTKN